MNIVAYHDGEIAFSDSILRRWSAPEKLGVEFLLTDFGFIMPIAMPAVTLCQWSRNEETFINPDFDRSWCAVSMRHDGSLYDIEWRKDNGKMVLWSAARATGKGVQWVRCNNSDIEQCMVAALHITGDLRKALELVDRAEGIHVSEYHIVKISELVKKMKPKKSK